MKIHYISCHQILEWDEVSLFINQGHDVFANGAYLNPAGHPSLARPGISGATYHQDWDEISRKYPRTELPPELIEPFDVIIVMGGITDNVLVQNWPRIKHKKVIWRTIGQSNQGVEEMMAPLRADGLKIVRMSPKEINIPRYCGADAIIRFYKDPEELQGWVGTDKSVINISQSLKGRRAACHYDDILEMGGGYPLKIYGTGNEDLLGLNGGELIYDLLKGKLRDSRVFAYGGTWPAPYTLSFIESMMTGIPMVCIGPRLAQEIPGMPRMDFYEVADIIENGKNGFVSDDMSTLRSYIYQLLNDDDLAKKISENGRQTAINLFSKNKISDQWRDLLNSL